ncbi:MAG TPA: phenylphosphate carboxylase subunit gamma [Dehalococcoidia bacterium]|nr:phenylphosphate carboxylase subunit gamma [Dehalococcoidia bacterium]
MAEYETFLRALDDFQEGQEAPLILRELAPGPRKYRARHVTAQLSRSPKTFADADLLWVRSKTGIRLSQPWFIKITGELPDRIPGEPYTDVFAALQRLAEGL